MLQYIHVLMSTGEERQLQLEAGSRQLTDALRDRERICEY